MEKNTNVSIAGIAFKLENDGYKILKDYLVRIELGYKDNPDGGEVLSDIEARICELILNEQSADSVVPTTLITSIIEQLGVPDDIRAINEQSIHDEDGDDGYESDKLPRRLYRSSDESKLGGVCGGLAAYFNIEPIVMRLIFLSPLIILPIVSSIHILRHLDDFVGSILAVSVMLYFILWFALPKAKSARQKLEMRGEKITASSISKKFRNDFDDVSSSPKNERTASALAELVFVLGRIVLFCVKAFALFFGVIFGIVILSLIVAAISFLFGGIGGFNDVESIGNIMQIKGIDITALCILILTLAIVPLLVIGYMLFKVVFRLPSQKKTMSIILGIWIIILIYVSVLFVNNFNNIRDSVESGRVENYLDNKYDFDHHGTRTTRTIVSNDSIRIETITIGDSTVTDTTKIQRFFRD